MSRRLGWWLAPLVLVVTCLAAALTVVRGTASSLWLLQQLPGVTVQGFTGTLAGDWQVERLVREDAGQTLELRGLQVRWRPVCLLRARLCLDELQVEHLAWRDITAAETAPELVQLPQLRLPLSIELGQLRVGELHVQDALLFSDFNLRAHLDGQGLQIAELSLVRDTLKLSGQGLLQLQGDWPLELQLEANLPDLQQRPWRLQGRLSGNLQQRLQLQLDSHGYLDASLQGWLQPLEPKLPLQLELRSKDFKAHAELPAQLHMQQLQLNLEGNLEEGYRLQGQARLPAEQTAIGVELLARLDAAGADLTHLRLQATDPGQSVELKGRLDWVQALGGSGRLQWQSFPWERLWPGIDVPVSLQQLQADLVYADAGFSADWQAQLDGPAGTFSLSSQTRGTAQQLQFEQLKLRAGQGRADGRLQLDLTEGLRWQGELQLQALDPGYWLAELPGELQGLLRGSGSYRSDQLAAAMSIDLQGRLRGQPAQFKANLDGAGQQWKASELDLRLGDNRVNGRLALDRLLDGQLDLQLQNLAQLGPDMAGRANGRLSLGGTLDAPQGQLQLQGMQLQYTDLSLQQLNLEASLAPGQRGKLQLKANGLVRGDLPLGELQINASGTPIAHEIRLQLDGQPMQIALQAQAGVVDSGWVGQLAQGRIEFSGQNWRLQAPMALNYSAGIMRLGSHCWADAPASLCSQGMQAWPQPQIAYRLREFPMQRLQTFWSEDIEWDASAQADIDLQLTDKGPLGQLEVQVAPGNLRVREEGEWLLLPYERLQLSSRLTPQAINSQVQFRAPELGELELQVQLDPSRPDWPLRGRYHLKDLDIGALRPFFPLLSELAGTLQGQGELAGSLLAPVASGNLQLRDGRMAGESLPLTVENFQLDMRLVGQQMRINGSWQSGAEGRGSLQGELDWHETLLLDLQLSGSKLPLIIEPNIQLQVEPDLQLRMRQQRLSVSGKVTIPSGQITVRELPPQAVRRSADARIVNATNEPAAPFQLAMNVELIVGSERLIFRGLGLSADVHGRLRVTDNLTGHGELQLSNGRFNAWGQRLTIRRARLVFVGPLDQPHLDIEAVRRTGAVTAGVRVSGRTDRPVTEVFSEPSMSEQQALSYLVLGRPLGAGDNSALTQAALAIGLSSNVPITGPLAERLAIRDLEVGYDSVAGRMFSDRLTVRYGLDALQPDRVLTVRYELTRRLYIEAASGLASSLDLVYRRDF